MRLKHLSPRLSPTSRNTTLLAATWRYCDRVLSISQLVEKVNRSRKARSPARQDRDSEASRRRLDDRAPAFHHRRAAGGDQRKERQPPERSGGCLPNRWLRGPAITEIDAPSSDRPPPAPSPGAARQAPPPGPAVSRSARAPHPHGRARAARRQPLRLARRPWARHESAWGHR